MGTSSDINIVKNVLIREEKKRDKTKNLDFYNLLFL